MNRKFVYYSLLLAALLTITVGCGSSDSDDVSSPPQDKGKTLRHLTIKQVSQGSHRVTLTPTTIVEAETTYEVLSASWKEGDGLSYCCLNESNTYEVIFGTLTATTSDTFSEFEGTMSEKCAGTHKLAVVYPATTFAKAEVEDTNPTYDITLSGQDGTLPTLQTTYHYMYGVATITEVKDKTATATMPPMKSLLTVCKFSFIDKANSNPIKIKSLDIGYFSDVPEGGSADTYPQSAFVITDANQTSVKAQAIYGEPSERKPLTITPLSPADEVYVALMPTAYPPVDDPKKLAKSTLRFRVTNESNQTYVGTATAALVQGEYVVATGLKLNVPTP